MMRLLPYIPHRDIVPIPFFASCIQPMAFKKAVPSKDCLFNMYKNYP